MPTPEGFDYWGFISYSSKDESVATRLHRGLETYRLPRGLRGRPGRDGAVPPRITPVFRDRDELPLSSDIGQSIEAALEASAYLVVVCSPHAANSRWVNEEIRYFKSLGREDRVLAIMIDGEPNASDAPDTADRECFPPALRYRVGADGELTEQRVEPIAGDMRPGTGRDGFRNAMLKAVAGICGIDFAALVNREAKRRRRRAAVAAVRWPSLHWLSSHVSSRDAASRRSGPADTEIAQTQTRRAEARQILSATTELAQKDLQKMSLVARELPSETGLAQKPNMRCYECYRKEKSPFDSRVCLAMMG